MHKQNQKEINPSKSALSYQNLKHKIEENEKWLAKQMAELGCHLGGGKKEEEEEERGAGESLCPGSCFSFVLSTFFFICLSKALLNDLPLYHCTPLPKPLISSSPLSPPSEKDSTIILIGRARG